MKDKKISLVTYVVTLIIMLAVIIGIIYFNNVVGKKSIEVANGNNEEQIRSLNINLVGDLYDMVLKYNKIGAGTQDKDDSTTFFETSFYKDKKITYSDLSNEDKIVAVLSNISEEEAEEATFSEVNNILQEANEKFIPSGWEERYEEGTVKVYSSKLLEEKAKEIFGEEFENDITYETLDCCGYVYYYKDGNYYAYNYDGGGLGSTTYGVSTIEKAEQQGDYIYIYDKFVYSDLIIYYDEESGEYNDYTEYYKSSTKAEKINAEDSDDVLYLIGEDTEYVLENYSDQLYRYKHTFKTDDNGNYYWVSSEIDY